MITLSVCTIMKNEEDNLPKYIQNLTEYVDEILLVDNGSTDNSVAIARSLGCKVIECLDNFDLARNMYIKEAKSDWILVLDIDEEILPNSLCHLKTVLSSQPENVNGLVLPTFQFFGKGKWSTWYQPRIIRGKKKLEYSEAIHGSVTKSIVQDGILSYVYAPIAHYDGLQTEKVNLAKRHRNIGLLEKQIQDNPTRASAYLLIAPEYYAMGDFEKAFDYLEKAIEMDIDNHTYAYLSAAGIHCHYGNYDYAKQLAKKGIEVYIKNIESNSPRAARRLKELDKFNAILSQCYIIEGKIELAIDLCLENIKNNPELPHNYINLYLLTGKKRIDYLLKAYECSPFIAQKKIYKDTNEFCLYPYGSCILYTEEL